MGLDRSDVESRRPSLWRPLVVAGALVVLLAGLYVSTRVVSTQSYAGIEHRETDVAVARAQNAVRGRVDNLARTAADYATWDDAYDYVRGVNSPFIDDNLTPDSLSKLGVDFMAIVNPRTGAVVGRSAAQTSGASAQAFHDYVSGIASSGGFSAGRDLASTASSGVLATARGPLMFAAQPITTTDGTKRSGSYLVNGRLLGATEVQSLSTLVQQPFAVYSADSSTVLPAGIGNELAAGKPGSVVQKSLDADKIAGFVRVDDNSGRPAFILGVTLPRTVYAAGQDAQRWFGLALLSFGVVAIGFVGRAMFEQRREVAERVRAQERTLTSEQRYREFIDRMTDAVFGIDSDGKITFANPRAALLTGRTLEELRGRPYTEVLSSDARERATRRYRRALEHGAPESFEIDLASARGDLVPVEISSSPLAGSDGSVQGVQWVARDVTERKRFERDLVHLANRDHLTGLYNRRHFEEMLDEQLEHARRTHVSGAVLWFDIDSFKDINDSLGHVVGDTVLAGLASSLKQHLRADSMLARIGGDEFAVLLPSATEGDARACANRLQDDIRGWSTQAHDKEVRVTVSMGVVLFPDHAATAAEIFTRADLAMYRAKEGGRNRYCVYRPDEDWGGEMQDRLNWSALIERALANDSFLIYSQPILRLEDGQIDRHELLIRMEAEDGGVIPPGDFLPIAERTGHISEIDRWMIRHAIQMIAARSSAGDPCRFDVNLSGRAFSDPKVLSLIEAELVSTGIDSALFGVEITETAAVADMAKARSFIEGLRRLGCRVALDDFGCGFSSFYYLRNLPIDCLKIDGSFVTNLCSSMEDQHVVRAIVELCKGFGIESTAEYVEDAETLELLREFGVTYAQGFHIARPSYAWGRAKSLSHATSG